MNLFKAHLRGPERPIRGTRAESQTSVNIGGLGPIESQTYHSVIAAAPAQKSPAESALVRAIQGF